MSMIILIVSIFFVFWLIIEFLFKVIILYEKKNIPWLITNSDRYPTFNLNVVKKFVNTSFCKKLGWRRTPLSSGQEVGLYGKVFFSIDSAGSRKTLFKNKPVKIATYGDSYAFGRQVNDNETWQSYLSKSLLINIQNFGVGNYGIDQALLRFSECKLSSKTNLIIVMFVPETICRIQSQWKHYYEFGNTLGFKPIFKIKNNGELSIIPNPIKNIDDFKNYLLYLDDIQKNDRFYKERFIPNVIRFPFILNSYKTIWPKLILLNLAFIRFYTRLLKKSVKTIDNKIMKRVMITNTKFCYSLYEDRSSINLLEKLFEEFSKRVRTTKRDLVFVVTPQMIDLHNRQKNKELPYEKFYKDLALKFNVIDLTKSMSSIAIDKLYVNDIYGGHLSPKGNKIVADLIKNKLYKEKPLT
jgi:hypothetical protein